MRASTGSSWVRLATVVGLMFLWACPAHAAISDDELALLRHDVGRRDLRMNIGHDAYELHAARLDTAGIAFDPEQIEGISRWREGGKLAPVPLPSPVSWGQITSLERRDSGWRRGALIGAIVLPATVYAVMAPDDIEGWAALFAVVSAPIGALGGGLLGAVGSVWVPVWRRPPSGGPEPR